MGAGNRKNKHIFPRSFTKSIDNFARVRYTNFKSIIVIIMAKLYQAFKEKKDEQRKSYCPY